MRMWDDDKALYTQQLRLNASECSALARGQRLYQLFTIAKAGPHRGRPTHVVAMVPLLLPYWLPLTSYAVPMPSAATCPSPTAWPSSRLCTTAVAAAAARSNSVLSTVAAACQSKTEINK